MVAPLVVVNQQPLSARRMRRPNCPFYLNHRPFQVQPFLCHPVLPGETLENLTMQSRAVTFPINNPVMGWWLEHYFFYVKLRDLYARDLFVQMLLDPSTDLSSLDAATDALYHHFNGTASPAINWTSLCLARVVDEYFRNEGEVAGDYVINGLPAAALNQTDALQSAIKDSDWIQAAGIDQNLVSASAGQGDASTAVWTSEIDKAMREYQFALQNRLTDMTFEDYCEQYGVKMPKEELLVPELIRYSRDWQYPSNTIDPSSGTPRSAVSWSVQERADKKRFFKEPGFILGCTVVRAKVYLKQKGSAVQALRDAYRWLPAPMANDPMSSWVKEASGDSPWTAGGAAYWWDVKDLFLHGEQYTNLDLTSTTEKVNLAVLPRVASHSGGKGLVYYPVSTDVDSWFVDTGAGVGMVRQDGIVSLHIKGRQVETSPVGSGVNKTV